MFPSANTVAVRAPYLLPFITHLTPNHQVTHKAIVDVEQLRLDLKEVFGEFLARANAVVDRHIEGP